MFSKLKVVALGTSLLLSSASTLAENDPTLTDESSIARDDDQLLQQLFLEAKATETPHSDLIESWLNIIFREEGETTTFDFSYVETNADWALKNPVRADEFQLSGVSRSVETQDLTTADRLNGLTYIAKFTVSAKAVRDRSLLAGLNADWSKWWESEGNLISGEITFGDRVAHVESLVHFGRVVLPVQLGTGVSVATEHIREQKAADDAARSEEFAGAPVAFMGIRSGNARDVVFLIDASGGGAAEFPLLVNELRKSIVNLSEEQRFTVIFYGDFNGKPYTELPPGWLQPASAAAKEAAASWIDLDAGNVYALGAGDSVPALRLALDRYRPELIFLLSDEITGFGEQQIDQADLLELITAANRGETKINTIQFPTLDRWQVAGQQGTLEKIAALTGGSYKFVRKEDIVLDD